MIASRCSVDSFECFSGFHDKLSYGIEDFCLITMPTHPQRFPRDSCDDEEKCELVLASHQSLIGKGTELSSWWHHTFMVCGSGFPLDNFLNFSCANCDETLQVTSSGPTGTNEETFKPSSLIWIASSDDGIATWWRVLRHDPSAPVIYFRNFSIRRWWSHQHQTDEVKHVLELFACARLSIYAATTVW